MLRHLINYVPSRLAPAISGVVILAVLTRVLPVEEYGRFALSLATMNILQAIFTQWLNLGLIRYQAAQEGGSDSAITASIAALFILELPIVLLITLVAGLFLFDPGPDRNIIFFSFVYYAAYSFFDLLQRVRVANMESARFSIMAVTQVVLSAGFAIALAVLQPTALMAVTGVILGLVIASVLDTKALRAFIDLTHASRALMRDIFRFAWPTIPQAALGAFINRSDRFILAALLGTQAVGKYNAGFSVANQTIAPIFLLVALISHPLAISTYEHGSRAGLNRQLEKNLTIMIGLALPSALGLVAVAPELIRLLLGAAFREDALQLIPIFVAAQFFAGIREHYVVHSFHLAKKMWLPALGLFPITLGAITANYFLISSIGMIGAAYILLLAQALALVFTLALTKRAVPMPVPLLAIAKIALASLFMWAVVMMMPEMPLVLSLAVKVIVGVVAYAVAALLVNPMDLRQNAMQHILKWQGK